MLTFDEVARLLDGIVDAMPDVLLQGLHGIYLVDELRYSDQLPDGEHLIMGDYVRDRVLGNSVNVYYGSVIEKCLDDDVPHVKKTLRKIVSHELRHHMEGRAGCDDLERLDAAYVAREKARTGLP